MSQHDYDIANGPGATVRSDFNDALTAIATNNSGATAPSTTIANMWWFDTSTNILKQRDNSNTSWINVAKKDGSGWTPYRQGTLIGDAATLTKDTDTSLTANSDSNAATQKAVKAYADAIASAKLSKATSGEISAMTEKTALVDDDLFLIEDSAASNAKRKVKRSNVARTTANVFTNSGSPHSWTVPSGVTKILVTMCGAGGGGAGGNNDGGGGGGGGSSILEHVLEVTPTSSYTVTVGAGGAGGAGGNNNGSNGAATSFVGDNYTLSAPGGSGGQSDSGSGAGGAGGAGSSNLDGGDGTGSGGTTGGSVYRIAGGDGGSKGFSSPGVDGGGAGGSSALGYGGNGASGDGAATAGGDAKGPGGGGGGGRGTGGSTAGGDGADGIVVITYNVPES